MSNTLIIVIIITIAVVVIAFSIYTNKKRKDANWIGTVIDKTIHESTNTRARGNQQNGISLGGVSFGNNNMSGGVTHSYSITVRPDDGGKQFNWPISSGLYEQISIGDKLSKQPGTKIPEIVAKAAPTQPPTQTPLA